MRRAILCLALVATFGHVGPARAQTFTVPNNAESTLAADHAIGSGTLVLATGEGARFGAPSPTAPVRVTVATRATLVNGRVGATTTRTIFDCTARSVDTLSGLTPVEGTADRAFKRGDPVAALITGGMFEALQASRAIATLADGATITIDATAHDLHAVTIAGNRTLAVTGDTVGQTLKLFVTQDASGGRTLTFWAGIKWPGGVAPTPTPTPGKTDVFTFIKVGTGSYYGFVAGMNF